MPTPSSCGYPDQSNTGVPSGVALTPSGTIVVSQAGAVISGKDVTGGIEVTANNVTIKDSRVTNTGDTAAAVHIDSHVSGTTLQDLTLRGRATSNAIQYAVVNGGTGTRALRLQMYNCTECWSGTGTLQDSYAISNGVIAGSHYEAIYVGGGTTSPTDIEHDTLVNPNNQTAAFFGDDHAWGPMHNVTINNNLLASGSDFVDTGCNGDGNTNIRITNNRFSGMYPGGHSGGQNTDPAVTTWSNNYWDETLGPMREVAGC